MLTLHYIAFFWKWLRVNAKLKAHNYRANDMKTTVTTTMLMVLKLLSVAKTTIVMMTIIIFSYVIVLPLHVFIVDYFIISTASFCFSCRKRGQSAASVSIGKPDRRG